MRTTASLVCALLFACNDADKPADDAPIVLPPPACTGFAEEPEAWPVAQPLIADYFMLSSEGLGQYWSLFDVDGDGLPDLIQHAHGNHDDAEAMGAHWYVWLNSGVGFGDRVEWTLPMDHRELDGLHAANSIEVVLDIDGDGNVDLVQAMDPDTRDVPGADNTPHWRVWKGDGATGFATTAVEWSLPDVGRLESVHQRGWHTVRDLDGDGVVEFVHTRSETNHPHGWEDGAPHWRVYRLDGDGFADTYEAWSVPPSPEGYGNEWVSWTDDSYFLNTTMDVTGDGLPDLVSPRTFQWPNNVHGADGQNPHWKVYENTGAGFADQPMKWWVPHTVFDYPSEAGDRLYPVSETFRTFDLMAERPALVLAADPETGDGFSEDGEPVWAAFRNTGVGFETQHTAWTLPDAVFDRFWHLDGRVTEGWVTTDLNGDGCQDLVLTAGLGLGAPTEDDVLWSWWVFVGE